MKRKRSNPQNGFALIEVLIAVTLLTIVLVPLFGTVVAAERLERRSEKATQALLLAQEILERKIAQLKVEWTNTNNDVPTGIDVPTGFGARITIEDAAELAPFTVKEVSVRIWIPDVTDPYELTTMVARRKTP
ncbi:prepilin-type N-terminal cleavage/methylation domain-containing protein [Heliobacterium chlorum]|uniref:Prepilin-type N-terminal cleavage/methylation domain-containing protein n=1 Tax=Heliobacterium chlorum TaxID=2698 RepID=A0ABR7T2C2_HELCL|nr:prepilin-type N-terminal cleavage/methylation domain-containing protein [Heliobacterium chlorum]MBC9784922.1 prepilin-type N-terminal cleavage/methylation domain-containing protein [Heliobacterium chlorum]